MSKQQKTILYIAGGALALYLLYRYYENNIAGSSSTTSTTAPDTSGTDYASLAGQEQSDVAALQGQNSQLSSQEQSDVAALQTAVTGQSAQEQSDVSGLSGLISGLTAQVDGILAGAGTGADTTSVAIGATPVNRTTISTHKGGPFYNYYRNVTGKAPPATLSATNWIWEAYKAGVKATRIQTTKPHPSAPRQTQVAHPNTNHTQQSNVHRALPKAKKPPPKASRPRTSGRRR